MASSYFLLGIVKVNLFNDIAFQPKLFSIFEITKPKHKTDKNVTFIDKIKDFTECGSSGKMLS